ncbi:glycosyltransferase [Halorubrum lipolyticum]|uniref:Group 1 glycosyl transferase n=1 Tax=Halorubrum lipolyticum DSM 21995 TaxID=1227482 RepID=M0P0K3_9EURY|nr:glycosyltransferase [Halorubrum lipolyticum]EMA63707.1 group 1 glycosyl transferase [Halorubrum lipolyticum DSM 21995]
MTDAEHRTVDADHRTADAERDRVRVLMCPDYTESNPYQSELIDALADRDVDVTPVAVRGAFPLLSAARRHGVPDVVHLHWAHRFLITERRFPAVLAAALGVRLLFEACVLRALGARLVWTVHNLADHERRAPRVELAVRRGLAAVVHRLVVHCDAAAASVRETYGLPNRVARRIRVVPHGNFAGVYPDDVTREEARRRLDLPEDVPVLLYFGLIRPYKNVPSLADTFRETDLDARLLVVGNPWSDALDREVRAACDGDDRIRAVLEYVPDDEVQRYMRAADAVVLPFDSVLTSGSAVLAMTFGRAVVAPELGCLPGLVGSAGGHLYDPEEPEGLADALRRAVADADQLGSMGRRNRAVARRLDWGRIADRTRAVYRDAALVGANRIGGDDGDAEPSPT